MTEEDEPPVPDDADARDGDPADERSAAGTETCAECGTPVDESEWYPIRGRRDDDGEFRLHSFCSQECLEAWEDS